MNRDRFRFRAWNKEENTLHYNVQDLYEGLYATPKINRCCFGSILEDDRYIVEQCTGLKDKNGKLIFEGDIVRYDVDAERTDRVASIEFRRAHFILVRDEIDVYDVWNACNIEVIGNIHGNPELLK